MQLREYIKQLISWKWGNSSAQVYIAINNGFVCARCVFFLCSYSVEATFYLFCSLFFFSSKDGLSLQLDAQQKSMRTLQFAIFIWYWNETKGEIEREKKRERQMGREEKNESIYNDFVKWMKIAWILAQIQTLNPLKSYRSLVTQYVITDRFNNPFHRSHTKHIIFQRIGISLTYSSYGNHLWLSSG